jgi:hypothetical protein
MSNLIFNLRVWRYHLQISDTWKITITRNYSYNSSEPFIKLFTP